MNTKTNLMNDINEFVVSFDFEYFRTRDLFHVHFYFINLIPDDGEFEGLSREEITSKLKYGWGKTPGKLGLRKNDSNEASYIIVKLPKQHVTELLVDKLVKPEEEYGYGYVASNSFLAFEPDANDLKGLSILGEIAELRKWNDFSLLGSKPKGDTDIFEQISIDHSNTNNRYPIDLPEKLEVFSKNTNNFDEKGNHKPTSIFELPYKLYSSPLIEFSGEWSWKNKNDIQISPGGSRNESVVEIWHNEFVNLKGEHPKFRIVGFAGSDRYEETHGKVKRYIGEKHTDENEQTTSMLPADLPDSDSDNDHRHLIHELSIQSDEHLTISRDFKLSGIGATVKLAYKNPEPGAIKDNDLVEWKQDINLGRDQFIKVAKLGVLCPFGMKVLFIKIGQRRIENGVSYVRYEEYVQPLEKKKVYWSDDHGTSHHSSVNKLIKSRKSTFKSVEILDEISDRIHNGSDRTSFWPEHHKTKKRISFRFKGIDCFDREHEFSAPFMFLPMKEFTDKKVQSSIDAYARDDDSKIPFPEFEIGYAKHYVDTKASLEDGNGETQVKKPNPLTVLKTVKMQFVPVYDKRVEITDEYAIFPHLSASHVFIPSMKSLSARNVPLEVKYYEENDPEDPKNPIDYVNRGFLKERNENFMELTDKGKIVAKQNFFQDKKGQGGLVEPGLKFEYLSIKEQSVFLPEKASANEILSQGQTPQYNTSNLLRNGNAEIVGGIDLTAILEDVLNLDESPIIISRQIADGVRKLSSIPREIERVKSEIEEKKEELARLIENSLSEEFEQLISDIEHQCELRLSRGAEYWNSYIKRVDSEVAAIEKRIQFGVSDSIRKKLELEKQILIESKKRFNSKKEVILSQAAKFENLLATEKKLIEAVIANNNSEVNRLKELIKEEEKKRRAELETSGLFNYYEQLNNDIKTINQELIRLRERGAPQEEIDKKLKQLNVAIGAKKRDLVNSFLQYRSVFEDLEQDFIALMSIHDLNKFFGLKIDLEEIIRVISFLEALNQDVEELKRRKDVLQTKAKQKLDEIEGNLESKRRLVEGQIDSLKNELKDWIKAQKDGVSALIAAEEKKLREQEAKLKEAIEDNLPLAEINKIKEQVEEIKAVLESLRRPWRIETEYKWNVNKFRSRKFGPVKFIAKSNPKTALKVDVRSELEFDYKNGSALIADYRFKSANELTNFDISFLDAITICFNKIEFFTSSAGDGDFNVSIRDVKFGGVLKFISAFQKYLKSLGKGLRIDIDSRRALLTYGLNLPDIKAGSFQALDPMMHIGFELPFEKDSNGKSKPMALKFCINKPGRKFYITAGYYAGGGFFCLTVTPNGIQEIEADFCFGGMSKLGLKGASGYGYVFVGIYYRKRGDDVTIRAYVIAGGNVKASIISYSVELQLSLTSRGSNLKGRCKVSQSFTIRKWVKIRIRYSIEKTYKNKSGGNGLLESDQPQSLVLIKDCETPDRELSLYDWEKYLESFGL